jgi:hypothetical protein
MEVAQMDLLEMVLVIPVQKENMDLSVKIVLV